MSGRHLPLLHFALLEKSVPVQADFLPSLQRCISLSEGAISQSLAVVIALPLYTYAVQEKVFCFVPQGSLLFIALQYLIFPLSGNKRKFCTLMTISR